MAPENQIRLTMFLVLVVTLSISIYYRRKANITGQDEISIEEEGPLLKIRSIGAMIFYLGLLSFLIYPPLITWPQVEIPLAWRWGQLWG